MRNKLNKFFYLFFCVILITSNLYAKDLEIKSSEIKFNEKTKVTEFIGDVSAIDENGNKLFSDYAKYNKDQKLLETFGYTKIITSEGYEVEGQDVVFDNINKKISSNYKTKIKDKDQNQIIVEMFDYLIKKNLFFSKGKIKINDNKDNVYNLSEIYIDEKNHKIAGTDIKAFLNQQDIKVNKKNEPRFFSNSMTMSKDGSEYQKGIFTYCRNRGEDKCPPWTIQAKKITHNSANKTIYYDNAVIKIYDFPILYFPKFMHPDPTVKRRSGFLMPIGSDNSNLGSAIATPYFWALGKDRDLTFTPRIYNRENPLYLAEYRHDFAKSYLEINSGYTNGYKKKTERKSFGSKKHFFGSFVTNFYNETNKKSDLKINIQQTNNDSYLKLYDVQSSLVDKDINVLENTLDFNYSEDDLFFSATFGAFENLNNEGNKKYEYLLPYLSLDKNILSNDSIGTVDFTSAFRVRNYDVNKQTELFVNDINWNSKKYKTGSGFVNQFLGIFKNLNYSSNNVSGYKENTNSEITGAIGYLSKIDLVKSGKNETKKNFLTPKILLRMAPNHMKKIDSGRLTYSNLFNMSKFNEIDILEGGLSASIGFDYATKIFDKNTKTISDKFLFSAGQVISDKEKKDMPSSSSTDQRFSDIVGKSKYNVSNNFNINYNFSVDQGYKEFNYNEVGVDFKFGISKFNINYLEEKHHIGNNEYVSSDIELNLDESNNLNFSLKRNLLTNSSEFYNFSYNYLNDCLKAGLVFRREFYRDKDLEPVDSLMFKISLIPFTDINTPNLK